MEQRIISNYTAQGKTEEILYIPKLNTDLFRDGNGLPLLRREIHILKENGKYREVGCDSTPEHSCPICDTIGELYYQASLEVKEMVEKVVEEAGKHGCNGLESKVADIKRDIYSKVPKKLQRVYLVVAEIHEGERYTIGDTPDFKLSLMAIGIDAYIKHFRDLLLSSDDGVCLKLTYPDKEAMVEKIKGRKIEVYDEDFRYEEAFKKRVLREMKSLHKLDIEAVRPELATTPYEKALKIGMTRICEGKR